MIQTVAVVGASGRLGQVVCQLVQESPEFELVAGLTSRSSQEEWEAAGRARVLLDVSHPEASPQIVRDAVSRGQRVVVGTSGWSEERLAGLREHLAAHPQASVLVVPNFSVGSVLGTALAAMAAPYFDAVEIIEAHHPGKVDSPSGTAVRTAEEIARARQGRQVAAPFADQPARGQQVAGVQVHSLRLAGVVAKQEVRFGGEGEVLTITHDTHSASAYRAGILAALRRQAGDEAAPGLTVGLAAVFGLPGA